GSLSAPRPPRRARLAGGSRRGTRFRAAAGRPGRAPAPNKDRSQAHPQVRPVGLPAGRRRPRCERRRGDRRQPAAGQLERRPLRLGRRRARRGSGARRECPADDHAAGDPDRLDAAERRAMTGTPTRRHHLLTWGGPVQETNLIERSYRWWALSAVLLVMFTSSISSTIVSTAVPTIVADLHGFSLYGWVFTGYILASTVTVPIFGKLSDLYGRRPLYLVGIAVFVLGAILAAAAQSMLWLICARVVSGLGGGAMMALSTASIGDIFSPRERGRWMGVVMGVFGLASIVGPTLGGTITDQIGWRYVFLVPLPLAAFAWLVIGVVMPRVRLRRRIRLDLEGSALMTGGLVGVLLAVTWGGTSYPWASWQIVVCFAAGAVLLALFVLNERRAAEPILSPVLFANRVFSLSVAISFLIVAGMYGSLSFIPLFVQGVVGKTAQNSGVVLTPMMLSFVAGSAIGGQIISRTGRYKLQAIIGMCFAVAGFVLFSRLSASSGSGEVIRDMIVLGIGIGTTMPIFSMTVQSAFPHRLLGTVNSGRQLFSNLGGAVAVPVMTAILVNRFLTDLVRYAPAAA